MIARVRRVVAGLPVLGALAATEPSRRTAQPLSAAPGSGLLTPYQHEGWCQTPACARWAGQF